MRVSEIGLDWLIEIPTSFLFQPSSLTPRIRPTFRISGNPTNSPGRKRTKIRTRNDNMKTKVLCSKVKETTREAKIRRTKVRVTRFGHFVTRFFTNSARSKFTKSGHSTFSVRMSLENRDSLFSSLMKVDSPRHLSSPMKKS